MGTEGVLFTPAVGLAILRVLTLLLIPVLPLAALRGAATPLRAVHARFAPYLEIASVAVGVLAAPLLLVASSTDNILGLREIFRPGGPWDLDFMQFLSWRALPLLVSPVELIDRVMSGQAGPDMVGGTITLAAAMAALVAGPVALLRKPLGVAIGARNLLLVAWGAYATIYTVAVLLWLANLLNFWCFLVLFALTLLVHD